MQHNLNLYRAALVKAAYDGYQDMNVQRLLPIAGRRSLSPDEQAAISEGQNQWIPKIFDSLSDSPAVNMADPAKQSLLWGAGIGLPVSLISAANSGSPIGGLGMGLTAGGIAAALAYLSRHKANQDIEETMRRLPRNANLRDFEADPLMAERRQQAHEASLAGRHGPGGINFSF